jgi:plasmid stabilization system protein ParE
MTYKTAYSMAAVRDLDHIRTEIMSASQDTGTAEKYIASLMERIEEKKFFPKSGSPLYYMDGFTGYYYVVYKAYIAFYRVDENKVYIDRILSTKSDYMRVLRFRPQ